MKVAFFSNYLNHHQLPFCLAMERLTGGSFTFVATEPIPQERLDFGYEDMNRRYPFVLTTYDDPDNERKAVELALTADVVVLGSAPLKYAEERVKLGRLTFRYSERLYKQGLRLSRFPRQLASQFRHYGRFAGKPYYMLCASCYTAYDLGRFGSFRNKTYKWGYFPAVQAEQPDELFRKKREQNRPTLLWAGRLLDWKHPEMALRLAEHLKQEGYSFGLKLIGNGELEQPLKRMIREKGLEDCVTMPGAMKPEQVRANMEAADIFLFTSDFNEGWGAVLNESMNSGCAVVASHAIGAVGFLMKNGENGLIFRNEDQNDLNAKVRALLDHPEQLEQLGRAAYHTLDSLWNAETAAERLLALAEHLNRGGKGSPFPDGPCSAAPRISNRRAGSLLLKRGNQ